MLVIQISFAGKRCQLEGQVTAKLPTGHSGVSTEDHTICERNQRSKGQCGRAQVGTHKAMA